VENNYLDLGMNKSGFVHTWAGLGTAVGDRRPLLIGSALAAPSGADEAGERKDNVDATARDEEDRLLRRLDGTDPHRI
jgi:hypothetical protein